MIVDDYRTGRHDDRVELDEKLLVPFDPVEAQQYRTDLWNRKNVEAAQRAGLYDDDAMGYMGVDPAALAELEAEGAL